MTIRRIFPSRSGSTIFSYGGTPIPSDSPMIQIALGRTRATAENEVLAKKYRAICLDPEHTTPGSLIAVRCGGAGDHVFLRPGEVKAVPNGFDRFEYWLGHGQVISAALAGAGDIGPLGALAFLVADDPAELIEVVRDVSPRATVCHLGGNGVYTEDEYLAPGSVGLFVIPSGLSLMRIACTTGLGEVLPVGFAATIVPYVPLHNTAAFGGAGWKHATADEAGSTAYDFDYWIPTEEVLTFSNLVGSRLITPPPGALAMAFLHRGDFVNGRVRVDVFAAG